MSHHEQIEDIRHLSNRLAKLEKAVYGTPEKNGVIHKIEAIEAELKARIAQTNNVFQQIRRIEEVLSIPRTSLDTLEMNKTFSFGCCDGVVHETNRPKSTEQLLQRISDLRDTLEQSEANHEQAMSLYQSACDENAALKDENKRFLRRINELTAINNGFYELNGQLSDQLYEKGADRGEIAKSDQAE